MIEEIRVVNVSEFPEPYRNSTINWLTDSGKNALRMTVYQDEGALERFLVEQGVKDGETIILLFEW